MAADVERLRAQAVRIEQLRRDKERRDERQISQETAAYEIGVSSRQYRTWEGVGATLRFENLKALAAYYDTTTAYIQFGEVEQGPTPDLSNGREQLDRIEERLDQLEEKLSSIYDLNVVGFDAIRTLLEEPPSDEERRRRRD